MLYKVIYSLFFILLISSCWKWDNSEITEIEINKILTWWIYSIELNEEEIKTQLQIDLEKITSDQIKEDKRIDDIVNKEIADKKLKEKKELEKYILADKKREELELLEIKMQVELTQERKIQELEKRALEYKK
jgi:hypothetical protein